MAKVESLQRSTAFLKTFRFCPVPLPSGNYKLQADAVGNFLLRPTNQATIAVNKDAIEVLHVLDVYHACSHNSSNCIVDAETGSVQHTANEMYAVNSFKFGTYWWLFRNPQDLGVYCI